jgi:hypothetical protein
LWNGKRTENNFLANNKHQGYILTLPISMFLLSNTSSTNTINANNNAAPATPTVNTDYTKAVNVKKVPFDGTEAAIYLSTTQLLGFSETYNCTQAHLGTITFLAASAVLSDADPYEHKLFQGRRASSTAMVLLRISLTDDIIVDQIYTSRTPEVVHKKLG